MSEEDLDPLTEEKQNYLRENILERGYDGNAFANFLIEKRGEGGADISNWSLNDLQIVVNEFISLNEQNNAIEANQNQINHINKNENEIYNENKIDGKEEKKEKEEKEEKDEKNKEILDWVEVKPNKDEKGNQLNLAKKDSKESEGYGLQNLVKINCKTIPNNEITKCENIEIKIEKFEKIEGKLFSKSYVTYLIVTSPLNWKVRRRFSDFEWLHQTLVNNYNYCLIPSIPKKKKNLNKIVSDKFDEAFLRKRSRKFTKFLSYLINDPILRNSKAVFDFLSIEKDEDFQKKKKTYEKKKASSNASELMTLDGTVDIEVSAQKEQSFNKIKENSVNNEAILKKINTTIKSLKDDLINASNKLKDISQYWSKMKLKAIEFVENENVVQSYEELSSMFENLSLYISKQNYIIFINLREYFNYVKNNYTSMKEFISIGENLKNYFYKSFKHLKAKKEDLWKKPESISKWDLEPSDKTSKKDLLASKNLAMEKILYKDTNAVNNQKILYGFYLNRIIAENDRMKNVNAERHLKAMLKIFEKYTDITTDFITNLADNTTSLSISKKDGGNAKKKERKKKKESFEENLDLEIQKEENNNNDNNGNNGNK